MKENVKFNLISYDLEPNPGFSDARMMTEVDLLRMRREKEVRFRKDKINRIRDGIDSKRTILQQRMDTQKYDGIQ